MSAWHVAPSLNRLRDTINGRWPNRDRTSDGSIGDAAHAARASDHNPDGKGCVHARDFDRDGLHVPSVLAAAQLHEATTYVIHRGRIFTRANRWRPAAYTGVNHNGWIHVSVAHTAAAEQSTDAWAPLVGAWSTGAGNALVRKGTKGTAARIVQALLNGHGASLVVDGDAGDRTDAAVRSFQRWARVRVDGIVGPHTWSRLLTTTRTW
jgi:hypothetical protein